MVVADGGKCGELDLREFEHEYGSGPEMYPFSRKFMLDEIMSRVGSITLESLLGQDNQLEDSARKVMISVSELKGRNVLLYLDYYARISEKRYYYELLPESWEQIRKDYPDSEIVFVPIDKEAPERVPAVPWLALSHSAALTQGSVIRRVFPNRKISPRIIAFGEDGRVRSVRVLSWLQGDRVSDHLFDDTLFREMFAGLSSYHWEDL